MAGALVATYGASGFSQSEGQAVQPSPAEGAFVVGVGNFSHIVRDLDRFVEFYRDVLGLELTGPARPFDNDPSILKLANAPGAEFRYASLRVPGSEMGVEGVEYRSFDRRPVAPRFQETGASTLILQVRNADALLAAARKAGVRVVGDGEAPARVDIGGRTARIVFVQDPDGFYIEFAQLDPPLPTTAPESSNIVGAAFQIVVDDTARTSRLYREALGFQVQGAESFEETNVLTDAAGTPPGAQFRRSTAQIPGTRVLLHFLEFKAIDRRALRTRFPDPGTAVLQLRVRDADAAMKALEAAGANVTPADRQAVNFGRELRIGLVRDPNNLFLELVQAVGP
jgi:catechol 2,3-dioxygenase-like lactoylglutathione lyase family enzyme